MVESGVAQDMVAHTLLELTGEDGQVCGLPSRTTGVGGQVHDQQAGHVGEDRGVDPFGGGGHQTTLGGLQVLLGGGHRVHPQRLQQRSTPELVGRVRERCRGPTG